MITYKGRVVYERIQHKMTEKDAARIMAAVTKDLGPAALAKKLWAYDMTIVKMQVLDDTEILEFVKETIKSIIHWISPRLDWLFDFVWDVLSGGSPPQPDVQEEMKDA